MLNKKTKHIKTILLTTIFITASILNITVAMQSNLNNEILHSTSNDSYDLLILTPSEFVSSLEDLANHKESHGLKTKITDLDEIYGNFAGRDKPEQIKYYIKESIENWNITYVLLVGNLAKMPVRYSHSIADAKGTLFISDLYYADIFNESGDFCSWDANNNNKFGELYEQNTGGTNIDKVDLHPDISIGRLLCSTYSEVEIVVNKIIHYENNTYNQQWFNNLILCGGNTISFIGEKMFRCGPIPIWEGEYIGNKVAEIMSDFHAKKLYASSTRPLINFFSTSEPLTKKNIKETFNEGAGFVSINAHGNPYCWQTYAPGLLQKLFLRVPRGRSSYNQSDVYKLDNKDKLPIVVLHACSCGDFSNTSGTSCPIAWDYVKHENGGAIACFASTTICMGYIKSGKPDKLYLSNYVTPKIFEAYSHGIDRPGDMLTYAINCYLNDTKVWIHPPLDTVYDVLTTEEWILFGDPSLKIGGYP